MYARKASLSADSMTCAFALAAASIALSRHRSVNFNAAAILAGSENNSDIVAPVVISVASELLDPDFLSCKKLLLLRLLLPLLLLPCCKTLL